MQYIKKGPEPQCLIEYKETPGVGFENLEREVRNELKKALLDEQGFICCYCGKRIEYDQSTILEHVICRDGHETFALSYENILASCDGGQGDRSGKPQKEKRYYPVHCDAKKGNASLEVSPLCPDCEDHFMYDEDGNIFGKEPIDEDAIRKLALNCFTVKNKRKEIVDYCNSIKELYEQTGTGLDGWREELRYFSEKDTEGKYPPYCFVARYYIREFCI